MLTAQIGIAVELVVAGSADTDNDVVTHLLFRPKDVMVGQLPYVEVTPTSNTPFLFHLSPLTMSKSFVRFSTIDK